MRIAAHHGALADRRELAGVDRLPRLRRIGDVGIDDASDAVVEQQRYVRIVHATHAH